MRITWPFKAQSSSDSRHLFSFPTSHGPLASATPLQSDRNRYRCALDQVGPAFGRSLALGRRVACRAATARGSDHAARAIPADGGRIAARAGRPRISRSGCRLLLVGPPALLAEPARTQAKRITA